MIEREIVEQTLDNINKLTESYCLIYKHPSTFEELSDKLNVALRRMWSKLAIKYDKDLFNCYKRSCNKMETYYVVRYYFLIMDPIVEELYWKHPGIIVPQYNKYKELKDFILNKGNLESFEKFNTSPLKDAEFFSKDLSKWDVSHVTDTHLFFKDVPVYGISDEYTSNGSDEVISKATKSFEEERMLREREWMNWKDRYLNEHIKFLEFTWSLDEDSIAHVRIRLELFAGGEYYRTGIIDSIGKIHKRVRTRELRALYDKLVSERDQRERKVEGKWKLIQSAKRIAELPIISDSSEELESSHTSTITSDRMSTVLGRGHHSTRIPKPRRPEGPGLTNTLGMTNASEVRYGYFSQSRQSKKEDYDTSAYLSLE